MKGPGGRSMIGRRDQLERLRQLRPTEGPVVGLVGGDAGIGKTLLLTALAAALEADGMSVLRGYATPASPVRPFDVLRSLVAPCVGGWDEVPDVLLGRRPAVVRLVGPVAPRLAPDADPAPDELAWVGAELLSHIASGRCALLIDDLHLADPETLDVLDRLLVGAAPVLVVACYRSNGLDASGAARHWITRVERRQPVEHVRLGPLDESETRALLETWWAEPPPEPVVRRLRERTGGNPFFLTELVQAYAGRPLGDLAEGALPATVSVLLDEQVCCLADGPRRTLDHLAVLGQRVVVDELLAVVGGDESEVLSHLRTLMDAGLVTEDRPDQIAFRHALVQEAVLAKVLTRQQRLVHQRALDWVLATGGDDALVVHHAAGAGHDQLVLEAAQRAAPRALEEGSPRRALSLAEAGLIRAPDDETLLAIAAQACWQLGLRHEARDHAEALLARSARSGDPGGEAVALGSLIRLSWESGAEEERHHWVQRLERVVDRLGDHPGRAQALAQLAQTAMLTGDLETAIARADEALALAEAVGDRRVAVQARVEKASAMLNRDADSVDGCAVLIAAIDDAERLGDVTTMLRAVNNVVHMSTGLSVELEDQLLARGIDAAGRLADPAALELLALSLRLRRPLRLGDRQHVRSLLTPAGNRPDHALRQLIDWPVTEVADDPVDLGPVASRLAATGERHRLIWAAAAAVVLGDDDLVEDIRVRLTNASSTVDDVPRTWADATPYSLALLWHLDWPPDVVRPLLAQLADDLRPLPGPSRYVEALRAELDRRWDDALEALAAAEPLARREAAIVRAELAYAGARVLASKGDRAGADRAITRAVDELRTWPGHRRARMERFAERLRAADPPPAPALAGGHGVAVNLTGRELEVAGLVAEGLSNGEIATRLFISRKTASVHVSNILAKLGATNRTEIATWFVRSDLSTASAS